MAPPAFVMHWAEEVPRVSLSADGRARATVWAGELMGTSAQPPPPDSWASHPQSDIGIWHIELAPGAACTLPAAKGGAATNRAAYFVEGRELRVAGTPVKEPMTLIELNAASEAELVNPHDQAPAEVLVMQGRPIGEPVAQHGPFVMNTQQEIMQAFVDYERTQFGGWPWEAEAVIFPRTKGRFSLLNGVETTPPTKP